MDKILITGGAGFIGYHLANRLKEDKNTYIYIADNLIQGKRDRYFRDLIKCENVEFIKLDLRYSKRILDKDIKYIYHMADINNLNDPCETIETNIKITIKLLNWAKDNKVKRILLGSSYDGYLDTIINFYDGFLLPAKETIPMSIHDIKSPLRSHAISKISCENYLINFCVKNKIEYNIVRYHDVYGGRMHSSYLIPKMIYRLFSCEGIYDLSDRNKVRTYHYIDDAVRDTITIMRGYPEGIFNVGSKEEISNLNICNLLMSFGKLKFEINDLEKDENTVPRILPDLEHFEYYFGVQKNTNFGVGLKATYKWYKKDYWRRRGEIFSGKHRRRKKEDML
jgi:nucleoside-diphosphate-sugar epimerase